MNRTIISELRPFLLKSKLTIADGKLLGCCEGEELKLGTVEGSSEGKKLGWSDGRAEGIMETDGKKLGSKLGASLYAVSKNTAAYPL